MTVSQADLAYFKALEVERNGWRVGTHKEPTKEEQENVTDTKG